MKKTIKTILALLILVFLSCEKTTELEDKIFDKLTAFWVNPTLKDKIWTFDRADGLKDNEYGFVFKPDQVFNERLSSGLCSNPPLSFVDIEGTWLRTDSLINITAVDWGGVVNYQWKIISIDNYKLSLSKMSEEYQNELLSNYSENLLGYWISPVYSDAMITYSRANELKDNEYGFVLKPGNVFLERKNSGWCGTPPIIYGDFDGHWYQNDSILNIKVGYWGGKENYQWKIISIENDKLSISRCNRISK